MPNIPTTSLSDALQRSKNRPASIPFTKQELAKLAGIKDLDERDDAMLAIRRQQRTAAAATPDSQTA
jgi:hypothetical protein